MAGVEHGYFSQPSNRNASRLLGSPKWREANTATSESFLSGYFAKSRLHHLSTWKSQMQDMVAQALNDEAKGRERGSPDLPPLTPRVIMHIDFDSFFVTVGLRKRQDLKGKPVVVCHSTGGPSSTSATTTTSSSTSEIASCSYEARAFGVRNGMSLGQARKYCPQIQAIPYAFQEYHDTSIQLYSLLLSHADAIEAVSVDEALIDVSLLLRTLDSSGQQRETEDDDNDKDLASLYAEHRKANPTSTPPTALATALRSQISSRTGCSASIGIGSNVLLARLATRKAKPGGVWHLEDQNVLSFTSELDVDDLHGIGWHTRDDLRSKYGTINVGELRAVLTESKLNASLGPKQGSKVYKKLLGIDRDRLEGQKLRQSVGANVNYAIRFANQEEAKAFVHKLCIEVVARLKALKLKGKQVAVNVMVRAPDAPAEAPKFLGHGICDVHHRSISIQGSAIDSLELIEPKAWSLITSLQADPRELRGIGVSLHKLELAFPEGGGPMVSRPEKGQQLLTFGKSAMEAKKLHSDPEAGTSDGPPAEDPVGTPPTLEEGKAEEDQPRLTSKDKGKAPMRDGDLDPTTTTSNHRLHPHPHPAPPLPPADELNQPAPEPSSSYVNMPTMSQIDPDMLSELPEWARAEVLRDAELGRRLQGKRPRLDSLVEEEEEGEGGEGLLNTPTKRRKVGGGTLFENMLRSGGSARTGSGGGDRQLKLTPSKRSSAPSTPQSTTPRRRSHQQPTLDFGQDPAKMTDEEVRALEIDPAVWRALPLAIQRELVAEHSAASGPSRSGGGGGIHEPVQRGRLTNANASGSGFGSGFGVLFKPGQVNKYPSRAEARKEAARKAARFAMPTTSTSKEGDIPHILIAKPATSPSSRPSLTTRTGTSVHTPHDIRALLSAWFDKRQTTLPRESEVRRIREYVLACVDLPSEKEEEMPVVGSARWDVEGAVGALKWWRDLLLGVWPSFEAGGEAGCEENDIGVARAWWEKWTEVRDEVERRITQRLSYPVRI
ncbi:hypothetical protein A4X13_0g581 [Tilletia indica]|uniref:DNA repair protein REV1 n=1 Tax=Tilletia indica TaxID=43049 RepID=A0A8T8TES6_9BASI|nr:hypothetical protein A4X13_0g581 [Tilletia indica]